MHNYSRRVIIQQMNFDAEVRQVKTMVDGSVNVTLNLPEYHVAEAQLLMAMIGDMVSCEIRLAGIKQDDKPARRKR